MSGDEFLIVDPNPIMRIGMRHVLESHGTVAAELSEGNDALAWMMRVSRPITAIVAVRLPGVDGFSVTRTLTQTRGRFLKGVILLDETGHDDADALFRAVASGASAYVQRDISGDDLVAVIRRVGKGEKTIIDDILRRPNVASDVFGRMLPFVADASDPRVHCPLTMREQSVLDVLVRGWSNRRIADHLSISEQTVKNHVASIVQKLNAANRTHAVVIAIQSGWASPPSDLHPQDPRARNGRRKRR